MQLEFHQLDRRWEHLRGGAPSGGRLLASLADSGQQTPIVVVAVEGEADRYVVIDGYKRIAALEQLGQDTVEAVVWPISEAAAVLLDRSLRLAECAQRSLFVARPRHQILRIVSGDLGGRRGQEPPSSCAESGRMSLLAIRALLTHDPHRA